MSNGSPGWRGKRPPDFFPWNILQLTRKCICNEFVVKWLWSPNILSHISLLCLLVWFYESWEKCLWVDILKVANIFFYSSWVLCLWFFKRASFSTVKNEIYATAQLVFEVICPLDDWAAFGDGSSSLQEWFWNTERFWHFNFLLTKKEFSHYVLTFCLFYFFFYCTQIKNEDLMGLLNELLLD